MSEEKNLEENYDYYDGTGAHAIPIDAYPKSPLEIMSDHKKPVQNTTVLAVIKKNDNEVSIKSVLSLLKLCKDIEKDLYDILDYIAENDDEPVLNKSTIQKIKKMLKLVGFNLDNNE